ncbi:aspartate dehydrogenase [Variovorax sp. 375MFSha3.1]|jgi:aspartate dehydrogenase|uniref:L-aspartate dehydrogenase n=1 Tax=Variovorax guangxiensis TaxID=1775474 RepID=A0A840FPC6_9BURK|nr:aspartate dehydrogenase [Variovorax guangxiensis]MBB4221150.1 aspartate dehydrogenase [Variovorax guangxiensis]
MTTPTRIALVGCGAIGTSVLELLHGDPALKVVAVVVPADAIASARKAAPDAQVGSALPAAGIDLVVETAGHAAIEQHVLPALARGTPCVVASVGALSATGFAEKLEAAAAAGKTQVQLIAGAIGAIDALAAARIGGLDSVRYTGRKPPQAWKGTPAEQGRDLGALARETVIFEGSAREAALLYPKNANVAATVSLAGLGLDRTMVRLIADPATAENVHTVEAEGAFGSFELTMRNKPLAANPKTSALTVYSAVRALRNRVAALAI